MTRESDLTTGYSDMTPGESYLTPEMGVKYDDRGVISEYILVTVLFDENVPLLCTDMHICAHAFALAGKSPGKFCYCWLASHVKSIDL